MPIAPKKPSRGVGQSAAFCQIYRATCHGMQPIQGSAFGGFFRRSVKTPRSPKRLVRKHRRDCFGCFGRARLMLRLACEFGFAVSYVVEADAFRRQLSCGPSALPRICPSRTVSSILRCEGHCRLLSGTCGSTCLKASSLMVKSSASGRHCKECARYGKLDGTRGAATIQSRPRDRAEFRRPMLEDAQFVLGVV